MVNTTLLFWSTLQLFGIAQRPLRSGFDGELSRTAEPRSRDVDDGQSPPDTLNQGGNEGGGIEGKAI